jgi:hypothetical protein
MKESFELGTTVPLDEPCAQLGSDTYYNDSNAEVIALIDMIERTIGNPPPGTRLKKISCPHDFGTYYDISVVYDSDDEESEEYMLQVESNLPYEWDEKAKEVLKTLGYSFPK